MDCVNHNGVTATAYCQNCGKALCSSCIRQVSPGQVLCEPCIQAWQAAPNPFATPPMGGPNPSTAAVLGLIPGVGAMYNGQFFKGFIHVIIFAVLVSMSHPYPIFGLFIAAWVIYQSFEAFHTAKARRDGQPMPDPLGLNELIHNWLNLGKAPFPGQPMNPNTANPDFTAQAPGSYPPPPPSGAWQTPHSGAQQQGSYQQGAQYQQPPYQVPYPPVPPPIPPVPPLHWRRREPIAAFILIGMGVLFLLGQLDIFSGRMMEFTWPLLLICLGAWLIIRRLKDPQGGC